MLFLSCFLVLPGCRKDVFQRVLLSDGDCVRIGSMLHEW